MGIRNTVQRVIGKTGFRVVKLNRGDIQTLSEHYPGVTFIGPSDNYVIGQKVTIGSGSILFACENIKIGDNTMIAVGTIIHTSTHDYESHPMWKYRIDRPVVIGEYVWIGAGSIILPGVSIGDNAVVGAGSVVTANVPEGAIVAGNPARKIKQRPPDYYNKEPDITEFEQAITLKRRGMKKTIKDHK